MRSWLTHSLLLIALAAYALPASADDWPRWRGPNGDGHSAETGLLQTWPEGGPKKLWVAKGMGVGWSAPAIVAGKVYITGKAKDNSTGYLLCLDAKTGKQVWKQDYGQEWDGEGRMVFPGAHSSPTVDGDRVYLITGYAVIHCFKTDGTKLWSVDGFKQFGGRNIQWGIAESPLVDGDAVYFTPGGPGASVVKLNKTSGDVIWKTAGLSERSAYCSPIIIRRDGEDPMLVTMLEQNIVGIDPATGKTKWKVPHKNRYAVHANTPLLSASGLLFAASGYGEGCLAIQANGSAKTVWAEKTFDVHHGGLLLIGDTAYGTSDRRPRGRLMAINAKTGATVAETRDFRKGSVIAAEGLLYHYDERSGVCSLVKPTQSGFEGRGSLTVTDGDGRWFWAHPAIANGVLYLRHGDALVAYDIKK